MTIREITHQLHGLSVGGYFNGERFSEKRLGDYLSAMLRTGDRLVMEISLPDGRWLFTISRYNKAADGYGYAIPETREQEAKIAASLRQ